MIEYYVSSNRIAAAKIMARHCLVDDQHRRPVDVLKSKLAPRKQRRTQGLKIPRRNPVLKNHPAFPRLILIPFDLCRAPGTPALNGRSAADRRRTDAGNRI